nr:glycosyltransferase family 4 protein [uncultured Rhodopila sp.]
MKGPIRRARPGLATATSATTPLRILIASHGHPKIANGGAEISAFQLFEELQARSDCVSWFLGCARGHAAGRPGVVISQPWSEAEFLYGTKAFDWFKFANQDARFGSEIERLFKALAPDVVHFHHYINLGLEAMLYLRRVLPDCRIVLTLHEYLAICHHYGQMVTPKHRALCHGASPEKCAKCFPEFSPSDFYLRQRYIMRFLDLVDVFIAPSRFLAERYIAWGLPAEKMTVLENLMPPAVDALPAKRSLDGVLRLGFFGQISELKGIKVIFDTAEALQAASVANISFEIFGDYSGQSFEAIADFQARIARAGPNIRFSGPYQREQVDRLMQSVHAVLVPSIWWENSPVVIQEALRNRRPVICSDVGGMAEKVRDGVDGFHFPLGNTVILAALLRTLADNRELLTELGARLDGRPAISSTIEDYLALYRARPSHRASGIPKSAAARSDNVPGSGTLATKP